MARLTPRKAFCGVYNPAGGAARRLVRQVFCSARGAPAPAPRFQGALFLARGVSNLVVYRAAAAGHARVVAISTGCVTLAQSASVQAVPAKALETCVRPFRVALVATGAHGASRGTAISHIQKRRFPVRAPQVFLLSLQGSCRFGSTYAVQMHIGVLFLCCQRRCHGGVGFTMRSRLAGQMAKVLAWARPVCGEHGKQPGSGNRQEYVASSSVAHLCKHVARMRPFRLQLAFHEDVWWCLALVRRQAADSGLSCGGIHYNTRNVSTLVGSTLQAPLT